MKAIEWPVATYGCESWTLRNNNNNNNIHICIAPYGRNFRGAGNTLKKHVLTPLSHDLTTPFYGCFVIYGLVLATINLRN